jgi:hypothetical protein
VAWLKNGKGQHSDDTPLWDVLTNVPSTNVANVEDMQVRCEYLFMYLPHILDHGMKRRVRLLPFDCSLLSTVYAGAPTARGHGTGT